MSIGRGNFTATLLTSGEVLVAGGNDNHGTYFASAELYDPAAGTWMSTGSMTTPRAGHTATLLADGKVLVAGGQVQTCLTTFSAELYDPDTGTWTPTGSMNINRAGHLATLITSGQLSGSVLVAGGYINQNDGGCGGEAQLASAELYDPSTGTWSFTNSMTIARDAPIQATLPDGSVLGIGLLTCCPYHLLNNAELFDTQTETWTRTTTKTTTANGAAVLMADGRVLVAGGASGTQPTYVNVASAELFDSAANTWTATASMSTDRASHTLTLLTSGQVLVAGGFSGGWGVCNELSSAELYDSSAGTWFPTGNMTVARLGFTATLLPDGQVLAAGGGDCEGNVLSSAELYTPPPVATLSMDSLTFGLQLVGTPSAAQPITLTNTGTTLLTISSITGSGDFLQRNNCGSSLPAEESCTIQIAFKPTDRGPRTGNVTITDDAANSPQTIALTGTGTVVRLSPTSLGFGDQRVGTTSPPQSVRLTNTGSTALNIQGIFISGNNFGDFIETTTCGSSVPANSSCAIKVWFRPTATGERTASVKMRHDGGGAQPINLTGTGR
jgi:N-acetylneuraminic acid mutarotase